MVMRRLTLTWMSFSLAACFASFGLTHEASADLLKPSAPRAYPDVAADINGSLSYTYDPSSGTGVFTKTNTPFVIATSENLEDQSGITTDPNGLRVQTLVATLDNTGSLIESGINAYQLIGSATIDGTTYSGLLLTGTPTAFGAADLSPSGINTSDVFDVEVDVTGGLLSDMFGDQAYVRIVGEIESTFNGSFEENFMAQKAISNTRAVDAMLTPDPNPIPEPSVALILVIASGAGLYYRRRKQNAVDHDQN